MNKCYLFTVNYPYTTRAAFVHTEVQELSKMFDEVIVLPLEPGEIAVDIPDNVKVEYLFHNLSEKYQRIGFLKRFRMLFDADLLNDILKNSHRLFFHKTYFKHYISLFLQNKLRAEIFRKYYQKLPDKGGIFYLYWFENWATILGLFKRQYPKFTFFSRAHGFDIFPEQAPHGFIPLRDMHMEAVSAVYSVSQRGADALKEHNPDFSDKVKVAYLGTEDHGINKQQSGELFTIVSCAHVSGIKRVHMIGEALKHVKPPFRWCHIGGFYDDDPVARKALENVTAELRERKDVQVELLGHKTHDQVFEFYKTNSVDLFISLSSTEGLPVTIMEATSFGIPVLATDVGGCREIVNEQTGFLVDKDTDLTEVALIIEQLMQSEQRLARYREGVRKYWEEHFQIHRNLEAFIRDISKYAMGLESQVAMLKTVAFSDKFGLFKSILGYKSWRHRIEIIPGVFTTGYNTMPDDWEYQKLPKDIRGKTVLDVGANDGFFSFEAERRGAASVMALDIYYGDSRFMRSGWNITGIDLVKKFTDSKVEIENRSIFDLNQMGRKFDIVICSDVLSWLADIPGALAQLTSVCNDTLYIKDSFLIRKYKDPERKELTQSNQVSYRMSFKYLEVNLQLLGFKIERIEAITGYPSNRWQMREFPALFSDKPVDVFHTPFDEKPEGKVRLTGEWNMAYFGNYCFARGLGWVKRSAVRIESRGTRNKLKKLILLLIPDALLEWRFKRKASEKNVGEYMVVARKIEHK